MKKLLRLGTRGSPLALIQAEMVRTALLRHYPEMEKEGEIELVPIHTSGDWRPEMAEKTLDELGVNKGLFTKELDEALVSGYIDIAVHSVKDMATVLPRPTLMAAMLERADPRDAFLSPKYGKLDDMPGGATVGTASLRRAAQILAYRPDLKTVPMRGNVDTRLKKLAEGMADATVLAVAGLQRLGMDRLLNNILDTNVMLPAVGQGAIGIVVHEANQDVLDVIVPLNHLPTSLCVTAERAFLKVLDGSCKTPIAGFARLASDQVLVLEGLAARPNGKDMVRLQHSGAISNAVKIGEELGQMIKEKLPASFFEGVSCDS